jgi:hypothetical protein
MIVVFKLKITTIFILRFRASVFLIVASIICILKIIVEIIKIMRSD